MPLSSLYKHFNVWLQTPVTDSNHTVLPTLSAISLLIRLGEQTETSNGIKNSATKAKQIPRYYQLLKNSKVQFNLAQASL
jgi:predicted amino acid racemase